MAIDYVQREFFYNKLSYLSYVARTENITFEGDVHDWVTQVNAAEDREAKQKELLEVFWQIPEEAEREKKLDLMRAAEAFIEEERKKDVKDENWSLFDDE